MRRNLVSTGIRGFVVPAVIFLMITVSASGVDFQDNVESYEVPTTGNVIYFENFDSQPVGASPPSGFIIDSNKPIQISEVSNVQSYSGQNSMYLQRSGGAADWGHSRFEQSFTNEKFSVWIYFDTNNDYRGLGFQDRMGNPFAANTVTTVVFDYNSDISYFNGTSQIFSPFTYDVGWHLIEVIHNFTSKTYKIFYDGSKITSSWDPGFYKSTATSVESVNFGASNVNGDSRMWVDDIKIEAQNVANLPPVADAGPDQTVKVGETVMFDGSGSYDPDGTIVSYDWDFGDGTTYSSSSSFNVSSVQQITNAPYHELDPRWSPDGQKLAISAWTSQWYHDIIVMNSDGTGQQQLTVTTNMNERFPAYSPDGTKIAYAKGSVDTNHGDYDIWVMNVDGSNKIALTTTLSFDDRNPDWSSDGSKIYFSSDRTGGYELWMMNSDGSSVQQLTYGMGDAKSPHVSLDGNKIGFSTSQSGHYEAAVLDLQTNTIEIIASDPVLNVFFTDWSSDGERILLYISGGTGSSPAEQWIMNSDGSDLIQLTFDGNVKGAGAWSPDGTQIAYRQLDGAIYNIYILTLGGGIADPLASHTYTNPGIYTVTLTVTDNDGATDTDTSVITVIEEVSILYGIVKIEDDDKITPPPIQGIYSSPGDNLPIISQITIDISSTTTKYRWEGSEGDYMFYDIQPDNYTVHAYADGFDDYNGKAYVGPGEQVRLNITLSEKDDDIPEIQPIIINPISLQLPILDITPITDKEDNNILPIVDPPLIKSDDTLPVIDPPFAPIIYWPSAEDHILGGATSADSEHFYLPN